MNADTTTVGDLLARVRTLEAALREIRDEAVGLYQMIDIADAALSGQAKEDSDRNVSQLRDYPWERDLSDA
jgi:hypothetical protein